MVPIYVKPGRNAMPNLKDQENGADQQRWQQCTQEKPKGPNSIRKEFSQNGLPSRIGGVGNDGQTSSSNCAGDHGVLKCGTQVWHQGGKVRDGSVIIKGR